MAEVRNSLGEYGLHRAAFHGDVRRVKEILETLRTGDQEESSNGVNRPDEHGKTMEIKSSTFFMF